MNTLDSLARAPFNLSAEDIAWVKKTRDGLSAENKIRQIYCPMCVYDDLENVRRLADLKPGAMFRLLGPDMEAAWKATRLAAESSEIPLLIAGDLEGGAHGLPFFSPVLNQIGVAACNDPALSEGIADVLGRECRAMGYNWSYTPVVDINAKFRSAIVGTRAYGSNIDTIIREATTHINVLQRNGIATTAKHWPGEGYDDRDQHLVTTVNPLSYDEWELSYGKVYRAMINTGVMSVMSAHIALPSWVLKKYPDAGVEAYRPGSVSKLLNVDLLRDTLGFNGLVVSDATPMGGLSSWAAREVTAAEVIQNGCDMYLFGFPNERDLALLIDGLRAGKLTEDRLEEAVTRVLGLKAALGLHKKTLDELVPPMEFAKQTLRTPGNLTTTKTGAAKSITLIKDARNILPITRAKHQRIVIISEGVQKVMPIAESRTLNPFIDGLRARGFDVRMYSPEAMPTAIDTDLVIYLMAQESEWTLSHIYIDWKKLHGGLIQAMTRFWNDVPTIMVSFGQMYYLYDAPRVPVYINAYTALPEVQEALLRKLMGDEAFEGVSPVDAFCGQDAARY